MKFQITLTKEAAKQYKKINSPFKEKVTEAIDRLGEFGLEQSNIKALTGEFSGLYRLRVGDYRVIFDQDFKIITIISILHRKDAYR